MAFVVNTEMDPITVTVEQAKELSGLGHDTIWGLIQDGVLEACMVGRRRLVVYASLKKLLATQHPSEMNQGTPVRRNAKSPPRKAALTLRRAAREQRQAE